MCELMVSDTDPTQPSQWPQSSTVVIGWTYVLAVVLHSSEHRGDAASDPQQFEVRVLARAGTCPEGGAARELAVLLHLLCSAVGPNVDSMRFVGVGLALPGNPRALRARVA